MRSLTGDRSRPVDLSENGRVERLLQRVAHGLANQEVHVEPGPCVVDDHGVAWSKILEAGEDGRAAEETLDGPGDRGRGRVARNPPAPIPEHFLPDGIVGRTHRRVHHVFRVEPNAEHRGGKPERGQPKLEGHVPWALRQEDRRAAAISAAVSRPVEPRRAYTIEVRANLSAVQTTRCGGGSLGSSSPP